MQLNPIQFMQPVIYLTLTGLIVYALRQSFRLWKNFLAESGRKPVKSGSIEAPGKSGNHMRLKWPFHFLLKKWNEKEWPSSNTKARKIEHFFQAHQTLVNFGSGQRTGIERLLGSTTNLDCLNMQRSRVLCSIAKPLAQLQSQGSSRK